MSQQDMPPLPTPTWARDHHGETEVYTAHDLRAYARAYAAQRVAPLVELLLLFVDFPESTFDGDEDRPFVMTVRLSTMRDVRAALAAEQEAART